MSDAAAAATFYDIGVELRQAGRHAAAETALREALALDPGNPLIKAALGLVLLHLGQYSEAWPLYEHRFSQPSIEHRPKVPWPEWRGEALSGKHLVVFPERGLGDMIMFSRFALAQQRDHGARVTLLTRPSLVRLFDAAGVTAIAANGPVDFDEPDYWIMSNSLAGASGATLESLSGEAYLTATPKDVGARIGVKWRGNPKHANDENRSLPPDQARRLLALPDAICLDPEDTGATDLAETAAIIAGLELVISVDTSVAHLAGALGTPVWTLIPSVGTDWRWGASGTRTPWYKSMTLYREQGGGWAPVVDQMLEQVTAGP